MDSLFGKTYGTESSGGLANLVPGGSNHIAGGEKMMMDSRHTSLAAQGGRRDEGIGEISEAGQFDNKSAGAHQIEHAK